MTWQEFTALLALATAMSFTPGPNTTLSTALAANRGLRGAMHFVCAVPVGWDEVQKLERAKGFSLAEAAVRAAGPDPWPDYFDIRQSITRKLLASVGAS